MRKVIYSTDDILSECLTRADMKGLEMPVIEIMKNKILAEGFRLVRYYGKYGFPGSVYICEWTEDGRLDSDDWVKSSDRFLCSVAENYIDEAMRHSLQQM